MPSPRRRRAPSALIAMTGRDPSERARGTTPLELLFDLTFVIPVGIGASQLADQVAKGSPGRGLVAFVLVMFGTFIAWMNFTWFASAFDTDDWLYRTLTMLTMAGVVIFSLGLPRMFDSVDRGVGLSLGVMVAGYVVIRVAMAAQWLRAAGQAREYRRVAATNVAGLVIGQLGWIALAVLGPPLVPALIGVALLGVVELLVAPLSQGRANATPWNAHHIVERYAAFAIITLGECVVGTVALAEGTFGNGLRFHLHWDLVASIAAGVVITFGAWWMYFLVPFGQILHKRPTRGYLFGYGHLLIFSSVAAIGAGLHAAGLYLEGKAEISAAAAVVAVAVPIAAYVAGIYLIHGLLLGGGERLHLWLLAGSALLLAGPVVLAAAGLPVAICLLMEMLTPIVTILGHELHGHEFQRHLLE